MPYQEAQQPDGTPTPDDGAVYTPVVDPGNSLLMVRPVQLVTGIFTSDAGQRFGIVTLRDQGSTFTVYLPTEGLAGWRAMLDQLQRDVDSASGKGLIIPGVVLSQHLNGQRRP